MRDVWSYVCHCWLNLESHRATAVSWAIAATVVIELLHLKLHLEKKRISTSNNNGSRRKARARSKFPIRIQFITFVILSLASTTSLAAAEDNESTITGLFSSNFESSEASPKMIHFWPSSTFSWRINRSQEWTFHPNIYPEFFISCSWKKNWVNLTRQFII